MNSGLAIVSLISVVAGILILVVPRLLKSIVALNLIVIGLVGLFGADLFGIGLIGLFGVGSYGYR